jgi:hypothetical protein
MGYMETMPAVMNWCFDCQMTSREKCQPWRQVLGVKAEPAEASAAAEARTPPGGTGAGGIVWEIDERGADGEFVLNAAMEAEGEDDMETLEEELQRAPLDPDEVKAEVRPLYKL